MTTAHTSATRDTYVYLNRVMGDGAKGSPMQHRLLELLRESKQNKAPPAQWLGFLKGLAQQGLKQAELEQSGLAVWLGGLNAKTPVTREQVLEEAARQLVTIKEVVLANPQYPSFAWQGGAYAEHLYIANSERSNVQDQIDDVMWEIDDLNFNMDRLAEEPDYLDRLEQRLATLRVSHSKAAEFAAHHFTKSVGPHGKNLIAHARISRFADGTYFIQEIQSDWGQQYQRDPTRIPRGPYITNTEEWAGLVLRRQLQLAAAWQACTRVCWITIKLRNGGGYEGRTTNDDFYGTILPKIAGKVISKAGGKVEYAPITLQSRSHARAPFTEQVPTIVMTPQVREALGRRLPMMALYETSHTPVLVAPADETRNQVLRRCKAMLGSVAGVRVVNRLYDVAAGRRAAGRYTHRLISVSLESTNPLLTTDHEVFHAAADLLLTEGERELVREAFAVGSPLHGNVVKELHRRGELAAAGQCLDPEETAAHAFALWRAGSLDVDANPPVRSLFDVVKETMQTLQRWLRQLAGDVPGCKTIGQIFESLSAGELARERAERAGQCVRA